MARKKKEETAVQEEIAVTAVEETKKTTKTVTGTKKPVRRGRKPAVKTEKNPAKETVEIKTSETAEKTDEKKTTQRKSRGRKPVKELEEKTSEKTEKVKSEMSVEAPMGTPLTKESVVEEKTETKQEQAVETIETTVQKPKRGRKPTKKPVSVEKPAQKTTEVEQEEVKTLVETVEKPAETEKKTLTNAQKNETIRAIVKELLSSRAYKWNELLDESSKIYVERIDVKDGHSTNDVRGRIGSVFDGMKKASEVVFTDGVYTLKGNETEEKVVTTAVSEPKTEEKKASSEEKIEEAEAKAVEPEKTVEKLPEEKLEVKAEEKKLPAIKPEAKLAPVFDMTLLLGGKGEKKGGRVESKPIPEKKESAKEDGSAKEKAVEKTKAENLASIKSEPKTKPLPEKKEKEAKPVKAKIEEKKEEPKRKTSARVERRTSKTPEEKLKESFLKKIRSLGGKYFEYYSVYLLERYSLRNGRRIDGLRVSGGDNDGGIDGEIEVTDRIGFRETIYIQAKNWNPIYGKEESWVIGETMLQQFIGAVAYRQAKEGKQHVRGIFVTSSYFTAGAKEMLGEMSDKFVGYDGDDLFEAAKECSFGLIQKDGEWTLDEKLLSGDKAFFNLY